MNDFCLLKKNKDIPKSGYLFKIFSAVLFCCALFFSAQAKAQSCSSGYIYGTQGCYKCKPFSSASDCQKNTPNATSCTYDSSVGCYKAVCPQGYWTGGWWGGASWASGITFTPACHECSVTNCAVCPNSSQVTCDKCFSGHYYYYATESFDHNRCRSCPANATCTDGVNIACKSGYYKKDDKNQGYRCASCPANATCSNNEVKCNTGYVRKGSLTEGYSCEVATNTVSSCPAYTTKSSDGCCCIPNG